MDVVASGAVVADLGLRGVAALAVGGVVALHTLTGVGVQVKPCYTVEAVEGAIAVSAVVSGTMAHAVTSGTVKAVTKVARGAVLATVVATRHAIGHLAGEAGLPRLQRHLTVGIDAAGTRPVKVAGLAGTGASLAGPRLGQRVPFGAHPAAITRVAVVAVGDIAGDALTVLWEESILAYGAVIRL